MNENCITALSIANKYLSPKELAHSMRVAQYAMEDYDYFEYPGIDNYEDIFIVALLHDVVEDTECTFEDLEEAGLPKYLINWIAELTKREDEKYMDYIKRIHGKMGLIIKRADMKDHLLLTDTLTDKLRNKYLPAIAYIL